MAVSCAENLQERRDCYAKIIVAILAVLKIFRREGKRGGRSLFCLALHWNSNLNLKRKITALQSNPSVWFQICRRHFKIRKKFGFSESWRGRSKPCKHILYFKSSTLTIQKKFRFWEAGRGRSNPCKSTRLLLCTVPAAITRVCTISRVYLLGFGWRDNWVSCCGRVWVFDGCGVGVGD